MKYGIVEANNYMRNMREALRSNPSLLYGLNAPYSGREGHLRLAREVGHALPDFDEVGQNQIFKGSYSVIYVSGTNLKPILDAKKWIKEMKRGGKQANRYNLKCLNCGHEFKGGISLDKLGWHSVCPKCEGSFDVDIRIIKITKEE